MKAKAIPFLISGAFTSLGFYLMFRVDVFEIGILLCFGFFLVGSYLAHLAYHRLLGTDE